MTDANPNRAVSAPHWTYVKDDGGEYENKSLWHHARFSFASSRGATMILCGAPWSMILWHGLIEGVLA